MIDAKNLPPWERALSVLAGCVLVTWGWLAAPSTLVLAVAVVTGVGLMFRSLLGFCSGRAMVGRRPVRS